VQLGRDRKTGLFLFGFIDGANILALNQNQFSVRNIRLLKKIVYHLIENESAVDNSQNVWLF